MKFAEATVKGKIVIVTAGYDICGNRRLFVVNGAATLDEWRDDPDNLVPPWLLPCDFDAVPVAPRIHGADSAELVWESYWQDLTS